ncbi:complement C3-like [Chanodichthys erythropterus]|uniref:complement C3-like n=1 Tax=Chanodichthys erythropterus TaxID=933992 RepID=UPI00351EC60A
MTAQAYVPKDNSKNYLHIGTDAAELQIGGQMIVNLYMGYSPGVKDQDFTYMILSKGQIVQADRFKRRGQSLVTLSLPVTKDMVPSFRFVADEEVEGKVRPFWARTSCRERLGLEQGKSYLIMGKSSDLSWLGGSLQYIFGERTWVEYWPTREESQTPQYRDT